MALSNIFGWDKKEAASSCGSACGVSTAIYFQKEACEALDSGTVNGKIVVKIDN